MFDAVLVDRIVYVAYYDAERWLTVAQVDLESKKVVMRKLASQFGGWDAHKNIAVARDRSGQLHVAGNMHTSPLVYARTEQKGGFNTLKLFNRMVGSDEDRTTYPKFFLLPDGRLAFSYRAGRSGAGMEYINVFDGANWSRWLDRPLFSYASRQERVNAYHTGYVRGPDGAYYIAWVWRASPDAATNFHVCFAKSTDLKSWFDSTGRKLSLPITPGNAEVVDPVLAGQGLFNNVRLGFDHLKRPVISYLKYDAAGKSQLYHARLEERAWKISQATSWDYRWDFKGKGTRLQEIRFDGVTARDGRLEEAIRHSKFGSATYRYDPRTLETVEIGRPRPAVDGPRPTKTAKPPFITMLRPASTPSGEPDKRVSIAWFALRANNSGQPRSCESAGLEAGCRFESELYVVSSGLAR
jgi:hypothetical protein